MNRLLTMLILFICAIPVQAEVHEHFNGDMLVKCGTPEILAGKHDAIAKTAGIESYRSTGMDYNAVSTKGHFRVHYNTTGDDAVPTADDGSNGIPDYVDSCLVYLEYAYGLLVGDTGLGFEPPLSDNGKGGGYELDVYLIDLASDFSGYYGLTNYDSTNPVNKSAIPYLELENDFTEKVFATKGLDALKVTSAHEFFHAVQFRYYQPYDFNWWQEQSAVWMEEYAWDEVNDYHNYLKFFFSSNPISTGYETYTPREKPLDSRNGAYEYGACVFPMYLAKTHGPEIIRDIWLHMGTVNSNRITEFNQIIPGGLSNALGEFAVWNYFTANRGNDIDFYQDATEFPVKIIPDESTSKIADVGSFTTKYLTSKYQEIIFSGEFGENDNLRITINPTNGSSFSHTMVLYNSPADYTLHPITLHTEDISLSGNWEKAVLVSACGNTFGTSFSFSFQTELITHVDEESPLAFSLTGTYPNPFNPATTVAFTVPDSGGRVVARAYNALGQEVATLFDDYLAGGEKRILWRPESSLAGGVYFIRVSGPWGVETAKTLFLK